MAGKHVAPPKTGKHVAPSPSGEPTGSPEGAAPVPAPSPSPAPEPKPKPEPAQETESQFGGRWSASDAGGAVLALVVWSWIALPLIQGGPERMRNVLRAKFLNKGPKGEWLP